MKKFYNKVFKKGNIQFDSQLVIALEEWIKAHSNDEREKPYMISKGKNTYTLNEILIEIKNRTKLGKEIEKGVLKLAIELLVKNKKNINIKNKNSKSL